MEGEHKPRRAACHTPNLPSRVLAVHKRGRGAGANPKLDLVPTSAPSLPYKVPSGLSVRVTRRPIPLARAGATKSESICR